MAARPESGNDQIFFSNRPNLHNIVGNNSKLSKVDDAKPPTMIAAIGPMISRPGLSLVNAIGSIAKAVTNAVIRIEGNLSLAP